MTAKQWGPMRFVSAIGTLVFAYLALIPFGIVSYARVKRQRANPAG